MCLHISDHTQIQLQVSVALYLSSPYYIATFAMLCTTIKLRGAEDLCRQQGLAFLPLVAESLGAWHPSAQKQVKKLGSALARHTGQPDGEATGHLWQRLGVLLQRGNANLFNNRIPNHPEPQVDGLL